MKVLKVKDLKPGMKFDKPVYIDAESILVPEKIPIKEKDLERLVRWQITELKTEGNLLKEEDLEGKDGPGTPKTILDTLQNKEIFKHYLKAVKDTQTVFSEIKANKWGEAKNKIDAIITNLLPVIKDNSSDMVGFTLRLSKSKNDLAESSVNCLIISNVIGLTIKLPNHKLIDLSLAALLHDLGMLRIPQEIIKKTDNLTEVELETMKTHPLHTLKIITKELKYSEEIGFAAMQHHERWDGKGYPHGTGGKKIHLYARIISVADAFEAMVSDRPYRNSMIGYAAMRQILNDNYRRFDSDILKIFIKSMGIYPVGSIVLLNDTSLGKVVGINREAPLRPELVIIIDKKGAQLKEEKRVDLLIEKNLFIVKAVHPRDIQEKLIN